MAASGIQQTTIGWQIRKLGQYASEWIELQLSQNRGIPNPDSLPQFEFPAWLAFLMLRLSILIGLLVLAWFLYALLTRYIRSRTEQPNRSGTLSNVPDPEPEHSVSEWLRQAKRWESLGDWQAACRALYMAALQKLHDRKWVPHARSRTDGEYLQAVNQVNQPRPYQLLIRTHERSEFGEADLTADNLKRCQQAYQEIDKR